MVRSLQVVVQKSTQERMIYLLISIPGQGKALRLVEGLEAYNAITFTTKEVINMTYEGLPTAARNVSHAVDFKIARCR